MNIQTAIWKFTTEHKYSSQNEWRSTNNTHKSVSQKSSLVLVELADNQPVLEPKKQTYYASQSRHRKFTIDRCL